MKRQYTLKWICRGERERDRESSTSTSFHHHFEKISLWISRRVHSCLLSYINPYVPFHSRNLSTISFIYFFYFYFFSVSLSTARTACGIIRKHACIHFTMFSAPHILRYKYLNIIHRGERMVNVIFSDTCKLVSSG